MNKTRRNSLICWTLIAVVLVALLAFGFVQASDNVARAEEASIVNSDLSAVYALGDIVKLSADTKVNFNGHDLDVTNAYMCYPNGEIVTGGNFELSSYGVYTLVCSAMDGSKSVTAQKTFTVYRDFYSVGSEKSDITYGQLNSGFSKNGVSDGLMINLAEGDTFYFGQPINIYRDDVFDLLTFNVDQHMPLKVGGVRIRLTDCYDPSIFVDINYRRGTYDYETYITAGAYGLKGIGLAAEDAGSILVDGEGYKIVNTGTQLPGNNNTSKNYNNITISLDATDHNNIKIFASTVTEESYKLVSQLNHKSIYDYSFDGFTNGNVYLSITASSLQNVSQAPIQVGILDGKTGNAMLPMDYFYDVLNPIIIADVNGQMHDVIAGVELNIPHAVAMDENGCCGGLESTVWYGYHSQNPKMISIENGKFFPQQLGVYTIEYRAVDVFGNVGLYLLELNAVKLADSGIDFTCTELSDVQAGQSVRFDWFEASSPNGQPQVSVSVVAPDGSKTTLQNISDKYLIEQIGNYSVQYSYFNTFYSGSYSYEFTASASTSPIFEQEQIVIPKYFVANAVYSVENVNAYLFGASGKQSVKVDTYISYDDGDFVQFDNNRFTVQSANKVRFKYSCNSGACAIYSDYATVVDVGYGSTTTLDVGKYFVGDVISQCELSYTTYTFTSNGTAQVDFVNPILLSDFSFEYALPNSASEMELYFENYYNRNEKIAVTFTQNGAASYYSVNGSAPRQLSGKWNDGTDFLSVSCINGEFYLGTEHFALNNVISSDLYLFTLKLTGVAKNDLLKVSRFCRQPLNKTIVSDKIEPSVSYVLPDKNGKLNDTVTFSKPFCADVLSPSPLTNCTIRVTKDGKVVKDVNGVELASIPFEKDYRVKLDEYGEYKIVYKYTDGASKAFTKTETISVRDDVAPTITLVGYKGTIKSKPSKTVSQEFVVSDNAEGDLSVWLVVYNERGVRVLTTNESSFELEQDGLYTVYIYCADKMGNTSYVTYQVNVK